MADTTVDHADFNVKKAGVIFEGGLHLGREFAGGFQDQATGRFLVSGQQRKERQREGGCFSGPGLGRAHEITPRENHGDGLFLDGGGLGIAH